MNDWKKAKIRIYSGNNSLIKSKMDEKKMRSGDKNSELSSVLTTRGTHVACRIVVDSDRFGARMVDELRIHQFVKI